MNTFLHVLVGTLIFTLSISSVSAADPLPLHARLFPRTTVPQSGGQFGKSVAASAEYIVIGAPASFFDGAEQKIGVVFVHSATTGALVATLEEPNPHRYTAFGHSVAVSGSRVVVGAYFHEGGVAYIYDLNSATPTVPVFILEDPSPAVADGFGAAVAISGNRVVVGAPFRNNAGVSDVGAAYVFDLASATPTVPVASILNPDPGPSELFGDAVAISGLRVVIGAPRDIQAGTGGTTFAGVAYVYDLGNLPPPLPPFPVRILNNPAPQNFDRFGAAVAIDGNRVAVGAPYEGNAANSVGEAYVYDLGSATPGTPTVFTFPDHEHVPYDRFGTSVAISGNRLAVGTSVDGSVDTIPAPVYLYNLDGPTPTTPVSTVLNPTPAFYDLFGFALALAGDRLIVSALYDDEAAIDSGAAYAYDLSSATPTVPVRTFHNLIPPVYEEFGSSVAVSHNHVVVGAPFDNSVASAGGAAYIYDLNSTTPSVPRTILTEPEAQFYVEFGKAVAISGNIAVIGAPFYNSPTLEDVGAVYVYDLNSATPNVPVLIPSNPSPYEYDNFGRSVAVSGSQIVVGVPFYDGPDSDPPAGGVVYVYDLTSPTPAVPVLTLPNPTPGEYDDNFGLAVAISGDRLVVAGKGDDDVASRFILAYVYDLGGATPTTPVATLSSPTPGARHNVTGSVAVAGNYVVLGQTTANEAGGGAAYVFDLSSAAPTVPVLSVSSGTPASGDRFGFSVAILGTRVAVGALNDQPSSPNGGVTYVYDLSSEVPRNPIAILNNPTPAPADGFGTSVALSSNFVLVGAPGDDTVNLDEGAAYIFGVPVPDISVEQPVGVALIDGASSVDFGAVSPGGQSTRTFTIRNTGSADLNGLGILIAEGADDFIAPTPLALPLPPGASTTFTVSFSPKTTGAKSAMLKVESNDPDENPFDITLVGRGVPAGDSDGDGLSDVDEINVHGTNPTLADTDGDLVDDGTEVNLAALGFNPLATSSALRALLHENALGLGLYRQSDVQNLSLGQPLLERDDGTGHFLLRIGIERSPNLRTWTPLTGFTPTYNSMTGEIYLDFAPGTDAAEFYRVFGGRP